MRVRAYGTGIIVREIDTRQATYGLIQVQRAEAAILVSGIVESIGHRVTGVDVAVGQRVWFKRQCGIPLIDGEHERNGEVDGKPVEFLPELLWLHQSYLDCECERELEAMRNHYDRSS